MSKNNNSNLHAAKTAKNDEFYTQLSDIENELRHYKHHFAGKTVLCNCDDPYESNFFKYFALNFRSLGLKKLIATCYDSSPVAGEQLSLFDIPHLNTEHKKKAYKAVITEIPDNNHDGAIDIFDIQDLLKYGDNVITLLHGDGDFRSDECVKLLDETDIVCTNVPFSLFREFVALMEKHNKKYLIIGNQNAITYKEVFPLIKNNELWIGYGFNISMVYKTPYPNLLETNRKYVISKGYNPDEGYVKVPAVSWYTNLDIRKRHEDLILVEKYSPEKYPKYDNYDAINVDKVADIPEDYVPCWFHCPLAADCKYAQQKGMDAAAEGCCDGHENSGKGLTTGEKSDTISSTDRQTDRQTGPLRTSASLSAGRKCNGIMGVPITFLDKYNLDQFEIIGVINHGSDGDWDLCRCVINGREKYKRLAIRKKMQRNYGRSDYLPG